MDMLGMTAQPTGSDYEISTGAGWGWVLFFYGDTRGSQERFIGGKHCGVAGGGENGKGEPSIYD